MWDAATGKCLAEIGSSTETKGNACFNEVASSSSGEIILVSDDGYVRLGRLDRSHAEWLARVEPKSGRVLMNAATMNEAGNLVAVGAHNQTLHIYEKRNDSLQGEIEVFVAEGPINSIRVATHKNYELMLFVGCYSGAIVRVARDGRIDGKFRPHGNAVKALRLHPNEPMGVSCSADGVLVSWDLDGNILNRFLGHMAIIDDVDIDPTGKYVASTGRDFTLKVYGLHDGQLLHTVSLGRRSPKGLCFYDETTVFVSNYWGELIKVSLPEQRVLRRTIARNGISSVARSGKYVVASSYDGATYLVDPESLEVVNCLRAMTQRVAELAYA
jgi:WD40 repeat protein